MFGWETNMNKSCGLDDSEFLQTSRNLHFECLIEIQGKKEEKQGKKKQNGKKKEEGKKNEERERKGKVVSKRKKRIKRKRERKE